MRRVSATLLLFAPALAWAAQPAQGRWEGTIHIPGRNLALIVDLAQDSAGSWAGSVVVPALGLAGVPLSSIVIAERDVAFDIGSSLRDPSDPPAAFKAHLIAGDAMAGNFTQGGNTARFDLKRAGDARVELPPRSTRVRREVEGEWTGEFELGGYPRHVTITFENSSGGAATATFVVVGKQKTDVPVDLVTNEGEFVRLESRANRVTFEGLLVKDTTEIRGTVELGPYELPLVLRRTAGKPS